MVVRSSFVQNHNDWIQNKIQKFTKKDYEILISKISTWLGIIVLQMKRKSL